MKKQSVAAILALSSIAVGAMAWNRMENKNQSKEPQKQPIAVKIQVVAASDISQSLEVSGTLVGQNEAVVVSETSGKITAVRAQVGDWLAKGQTLVIIEHDLKQVTVDQAQAQLMAAQNQFDKTQKDLERYEKLFEQQIATQNDIENARLAARGAEAQLRSAEADLKLAQRQLDDTNVKAPLAGRLADRYVNEAAMIMPGDKIGVIVDGRNMKLKSSVAENQIAKVKSGQPVRVTADALPSRSFAGRVISVAQKSNNERTYPIEVLIQNDSEESLKSGMFARGIIEVATSTSALVVPAAAVLSEAGSQFVYVEKNGAAQRVPVKVGIEHEGRVEILSGVNKGAHLIVAGHQRVVDGDPVVVEQ